MNPDMRVTSNLGAYGGDQALLNVSARKRGAAWGS